MIGSEHKLEEDGGMSMQEGVESGQIGLEKGRLSSYIICSKRW